MFDLKLWGSRQICSCFSGGYDTNKPHICEDLLFSAFVILNILLWRFADYFRQIYITCSRNVCAKNSSFFHFRNIHELSRYIQNLIQILSQVWLFSSKTAVSISWILSLQVSTASGSGVVPLFSGQYSCFRGSTPVVGTMHQIQGQYPCFRGSTPDFGAVPLFSG